MVKHFFARVRQWISPGYACPTARSTGKIPRRPIFETLEPRLLLSGAPGGVDGGDLQLWLRADAGVTQAGTVSQWANQVANGTLPNVQQSTSTERPTYNASTLNFNPVITFDGVDDD